MEALGPFEAAPILAVAVSGGADSMALALLAHDWAQARSGRAIALTVDHGLRPASADEAANVQAWMSGQGIESHILRWRGEKPPTRIQERAREARYRLLCGWCHGAGVLHLLLGHHRQDQAETLLHRLFRGSGAHGLAGMAPLVETPFVRLLRPLLACAPDELRALLVERRQGWLEDPSNRDPRFARTALRALSACSPQPADLVLAAQPRMARARAAMDDAVAALAARTMRIHPAGFAVADRAALRAASPEIAVTLLARAAGTVGGAPYACGAERARCAFERIVADERGDVSRPAGTTLARCRLIGRGDRLLVCREARGLPCPQSLPAEGLVGWDGRLRVWLDAGRREMAGTVVIRPFRPSDLADLREGNADGGLRRLPPSVRTSLPVGCDAAGRAVAPPYWGAGECPGPFPAMVVHIGWCPRYGITGAGYFLVREN